MFQSNWKIVISGKEDHIDSAWLTTYLYMSENFLIIAYPLPNFPGSLWYIDDQRLKLFSHLVA